jgi:hypothetical protein
MMIDVLPFQLSYQLHPELSMPSTQHHLTMGGDSTEGVTYFAYHIRRGDFQYEFTKLSAQEIWSNTKDLLNQNRSRLIYIATDERDRSFFRPFRNASDPTASAFKVVFLDDFISRIVMPGNRKLNHNHIGKKGLVSLFTSDHAVLTRYLPI